MSDSVTEERVAQVSLDALPAALSVGDLAEVTLTLPSTEPTVTLPNAAVRRWQGRTGVWTVQGNALRFVAVRLGESSLDGLVQIADGIQVDTTVVVYSEKELTAGSRISVVESLVGHRP